MFAHKTDIKITADELEERPRRVLFFVAEKGSSKSIIPDLNSFVAEADVAWSPI